MMNIEILDVFQYFSVIKKNSQYFSNVLIIFQSLSGTKFYFPNKCLLKIFYIINKECFN